MSDCLGRGPSVEAPPYLVEDLHHQNSDDDIRKSTAAAAISFIACHAAIMQDD
jgi:hypothetical protein